MIFYIDFENYTYFYDYYKHIIKISLKMSQLSNEQLELMSAMNKIRIELIK